MKLISLFILILFTFLIACSSEEDNVPPVCTISDPPANSVFTVNDDMLIMINALDTDGAIAEIELLFNEDVIGTSNASSFEYIYDLDGKSPGTYMLKAKVTDDKGSETSKEIQISVKPALEVFTDSRDGNVYRFVTVGDQIWMADNLAYLPSVRPSTDGSVNTPMYYVFGYEGNDVFAAKSEENYSLYGVLYNWKAANSCCPDGWRLPTQSDWKDLEDHIVEEYGKFAGSYYDWATHWVGMGPHLMHTSGWGIHPHGMNTYSFSALPAGGVTFSDIEDCSVCSDELATEWWSSTLRVDVVITRTMTSEAPLSFSIHRHVPQDFGLSVRCIKKE